MSTSAEASVVDGLRVLVLAGGLSPERDVSIRSGRRVSEALRDRGIVVEVADVDAQLLQRLSDDRPHCVIPLLHGAAGEDGALRDVLDAVSLPYVGSTGDGCRAVFDKPAATARLRRSGFHVPRSVALPHSAFRELGAASVLTAFVEFLHLPLVVKPTKGGSALGVSIVRDAADLPAAMVGAFAYGDTVMLEEFVEGTEIAVSVIDDGITTRALPPVEIRPDSGVYDYHARYTAGATEFFVPARLDPPALDEAARVAVARNGIDVENQACRIADEIRPAGDPRPRRLELHGSAGDSDGAGEAAADGGEVDHSPRSDRRTADVRAEGDL